MAYPGNVMVCETLIETNNLESDDSNLIYVIFQKMASMAFGASVGIEWWDEVYLKESLADYAFKLCYEAYYNQNKKDGENLASPCLVNSARKVDGFIADLGK